MKDFAAVTCFYSYVGNPYAVERYREFQKNLKRQGVELYTVELAFFNEGYLLSPPVNARYRIKDCSYLRLRTDTVLWHKESLINILVDRLPPHIKKVAWLDCDISIQNDDWAEETSKLLDNYRVVEIGSRHVYLDKNGEKERAPMTTGYGYQHHKKEWKDFSKYHPGLGWAAHRDLFAHGGLFKYCISGGGDGLMACLFGASHKESSLDMQTWLPRWKYKNYKEYCPTIIDKIEEYKSEVCSYVDGSMSYSTGDVIHKYHAPSRRRGYRSRPGILKGINFHEDLLEDKNKLFKWRDPNYSQVFETFFNIKDGQRDNMVSYENVNLKGIIGRRSK